MKILIMGLPGSGKTTLATALARELSCVHFNADEVRKEINIEIVPKSLYVLCGAEYLKKH